MLVSGWAAHYFSVTPVGYGPDLDDAGRWIECEAVDSERQQHPAQLELEVERFTEGCWRIGCSPQSHRNTEKTGSLLERSMQIASAGKLQEEEE
jgi:hypothetical protein